MAKFESFDPKRNNWTRYCQQLKFFLVANQVKEDLKLPTILTLMGTTTFNLYCDLIAPDLPDSKPVEELFKILDEHFNPKMIARAERFKLRCRKQEQGESIADFAAALRKISINCGYKEDLDSQLADQFVFGVASQMIQKKLLTEVDGTSFTSLIQIASIAEITSKDAAKLSGTLNKEEEEIFKIKTSDKKLYSDTNCRHCGSNHPAQTCKFKNFICFFCKKEGHLISICRSRKNQNINKKYFGNSQRKLQRVSEIIDPDETLLLNNLSINQLEGSTVKPYFINVKVNNIPVSMEIDTGASISLLPLHLFREKLGNVKIIKTEVRLNAFQKIIIPIGKAIVNVTYNNKTAHNQELFIIKECSIPLLGRTWIKALNLFEGQFPILALNIDTQYQLDLALSQHKNLFIPELGLIKDFKAHIDLKEDFTPKFCKHRQVPFALLPKIEAELEKLQKQNIIEPIKYSDWAAPIVPILKKDNTLRICADYKIGLNKNIIVDQYPLPAIDEILAKLSSGTIFSKLDLSQAYQQVVVDDKSAKYLTINTHKGLFCVKRLPFGIASAPAIFQELMDKILQGAPNTTCYLDDILIASPDENTHFKDLEIVLDKLEKNGVRLNKQKCEFLKSEIEYLGHIINAKGIQPAKTKINAILTAPEPQNVDQLRSFLGLVSYYRKFLPNLSTILAPLNNRLCKNVKWSWDSAANQAFTKIKELVSTPPVLTHYNPMLPIVIASDASPTGLGAILSHTTPEGCERPIAFASRTLTTAEKNYSQLDKEALGIIFAVKKFHQYVFGRKFTLVTDHKPLTYIFNANKQIPILAAARIQRWALILSAYNYDIKYRTSKQNANADALSRLPCKVTQASEAEIGETTLMLDQIEDFPWTFQEIARETAKDETLSKITQYLKNGWPHKSSTILKNFQSKKDELSLQGDCIMWGNRVVIPKTLQPMLLLELHKNHTGMVRMKMLARTLFWWPGIDKEIEQTSQRCRTCSLQSKDPPKAPLHPWIRPDGPWERIHVDFAGPVAGNTFLVIVDAYSKWPEVIAMTSTTTLRTALVLEGYFSRYGYPKHLVSDNGTQFTSEAFATFCKNRGIHHTLSPPYHPASNGQAERYVQILKNFLSKLDDYTSLAVKINNMLFTYRSTPHTVTRKTPSELFLGRQLRNRLELIRPPGNTTNFYSPDRTTSLRSFDEGDLVLSKSFNKNKQAPRWEPGVIQKKYGPVTYLVRFKNEKFGKRHINQLRKSHLPPEPPPMATPEDKSIVPAPEAPEILFGPEAPEILFGPVPEMVEAPVPETEEAPVPETVEAPEILLGPPNEAPPNNVNTQRYPERLRQPPCRYSSTF